MAQQIPYIITRHLEEQGKHLETECVPSGYPLLAVQFSPFHFEFRQHANAIELITTYHNISTNCYKEIQANEIKSSLGNFHAGNLLTQESPQLANYCRREHLFVRNKIVKFLLLSSIVFQEHLKSLLVV